MFSPSPTPRKYFLRLSIKSQQGCFFPSNMRRTKRCHSIKKSSATAEEKKVHALIILHRRNFLFKYNLCFHVIDTNPFHPQTKIKTQNRTFFSFSDLLSAEEASKGLEMRKKGFPRAFTGKTFPRKKEESKTKPF